MGAASLVDRYGWKEANVPCSCAYVVPDVLHVIAPLKARRVLDLGAGNGALCGLLKKEGYSVAGCEYDAKGVEIARATYPEVPFYQYGVQDDLSKLLEESGFEVLEFRGVGRVASLWKSMVLVCRKRASH